MSIFINQKELAEKKDIKPENLLVGTHDFSGNKWFLGGGGSAGSVKKSSQLIDPNGNIPAMYDWEWNGLTQPIQLKKDEIITVGGYLKLDKDTNDKIHAYAISSSSNHSMNPLYGYVNGQKIQFGIDNLIKETDSNPSTDWLWTAITFRITEDDQYRIRFEHEKSNLCSIGSLIIAKTDHLSQWYPNTNDYAFKSELDNLKSEIQVLKNKIGGVTRHLYTALRKALATSTEMEVA